jgi:hypothetical protein
VIPSAEAVPVAIGELLDGLELEEGERAVLASVDDDRSVGEICLHTHSSEFFVAKLFRRMVEAGKLKVVRPRHVQPAVAVQVSDPAVLVAEAGRLFRAGDYQHALRHARAAAALGPDNAVVREDVVRLEAALRETIEADGVKLDRVPKLVVEISQMARLNLSPEEGFILTRIDGTSTVGSILKITPVAQLDAMLVFLRLIKAGHIRLGRIS